jgi:hypothetical protein
MQRTILTYGLISGVIIILGMITTIVLSAHHNLWLGYLIMLVGLSSILLAVKQHRDKVLGGVIKFWPAFLVGLGVAVVAGLAYVAVWEVYLALTHYRFMDEYTASYAGRARRPRAPPAAEYAKKAAEMATMNQNYANPLYRMPMTFSEIFPVGLLVARGQRGPAAQSRSSCRRRS